MFCRARSGVEPPAVAVTPLSRLPWGKLVEGAGNNDAMHSIEATRRLVVSAERQSEASGRLSRVMIAVMIVQALVAVAQIVIAFAEAR